MRNTVTLKPVRFLSSGIRYSIVIFMLNIIGPNESTAMKDWPSQSPEQAALSSDLGGQLDQAFAQGELKNLHSVLVIRQQQIAVEKYYPGADELWGTPLGKIDFNAQTLHDLRSITKSIVSLLYGIALGEGRVPTVSQPVIASFSDYQDLTAKQAIQDITIEHALTMTMGLAWNENLPYSDPANSEIAMERANDRYRYILSREVLYQPGKQWEYSGGATALLGKLINQNIDTGILDYAQAKLFKPLGIAHVEWTKGYNGEESVASGLRMIPRDLARIGQLILNRGVWDGKQIVPENWLNASFKNRADAGDGLEYGYHWWLGKMRGTGARWIAGFGNGSQRLIVIPALDVVVVITAGNYNQPEQWRLPVKIMAEFIVPALQDS